MTLAEYQDKTDDKYLSFHKDELILICEQNDEIWYSGQLNGIVNYYLFE